MMKVRIKILAMVLVYLSSNTAAFSVPLRRSVAPPCRRPGRCPSRLWEGPSDPPFASSDSSTHDSEEKKKDGCCNNGSMSSALAIVPPEEAWDTIQRARHLCRDPTYHKVPPAIRLFHPFVPRTQASKVATTIADFVEAHNIEPMEITLENLVILPHWERIEQDHAQWSQLPRISDETTTQTDDHLFYKKVMDRNTAQLIDAEVTKGREALVARRIRSRKRELAKQSKLDESETDTDPQSSSLSSQQQDAQISITKEEMEEIRRQVIRDQEEEWSRLTQVPDFGDEGRAAAVQTSTGFQRSLLARELLDRQKNMMERFNGPCVLCLEPNEDSKHRLEELRESMRRELFDDYDGFSVSATNFHHLIMGDTSTSTSTKTTKRSSTSTSTFQSKTPVLPEIVTTRHKQGGPGSTYQASIPLGYFSSVTAAVKSARGLQKVWEPLTFNVTDFHLMSQTGGFSVSQQADTETESSQQQEQEQEQQHVNREQMLQLQWKQQQQDGAGGAGAIRSRPDGNTVVEQLLSTSDQFGCDAMVMFMGEEQVEDLCEEDAALLDLLMVKEGETGGMQIVLDNYDTIASTTASPSSLTQKNYPKEEESWEEFLSEEEDDWDEGATVVIGRTHFFMGELRHYVGMPSSSTMDGKDRILGDSVSAVAKRKGAVKRQGSWWKDGDFGYSPKDYLP
eukprot:scaffold4645_cov50-Attheya_sp.AAC.2